MKPVRLLVFIASIAFVIEGFRLVTQAGLQGSAGTIQNDGYAVTGGLMILAAGLLAGYLFQSRERKKLK